MAKLVTGRTSRLPTLIIRFLRVREVLNQALLVLAAIVGAAILTLSSCATPF